MCPLKVAVPRDILNTPPPPPPKEPELCWTDKELHKIQERGFVPIQIRDFKEILSVVSKMKHADTGSYYVLI
jgi:hypothetical protein